MKFWHLVLCLWLCSLVSWFTACGNLNRIYILLLCENCINLNYVELIHSAFMKFSSQEYWNGLPFPFLGYLPNPGSEPLSLVSYWRVSSSPLLPPGKPPKQSTCQSDTSLGKSVLNSCTKDICSHNIPHYFL